ncbi:MAG: RDD family protein [Desulfuromonadales bacterium]|nr:RDD family protein [Desulfuromonadales bacterium]
MKCPKCGYNSFDYLDSCKKCGKDLVEFKQRFGIKSVLFPGVTTATAASLAEDEGLLAVETSERAAATALGAADVSAAAKAPAAADDSSSGDDFGFDFMGESSDEEDLSFDELFEEAPQEEDMEETLEAPKGAADAEPATAGGGDFAFDVPEADDELEDDFGFDVEGVATEEAEPGKTKGSEEGPSDPFDLPESSAVVEAPVPSIPASNVTTGAAAMAESAVVTGQRPDDQSAVEDRTPFAAGEEEDLFHDSVVEHNQGFVLPDETAAEFLSLEEGAPELLPASLRGRFASFVYDAAVLLVVGVGFVVAAEVSMSGQAGPLPTLDRLIDLSVPYFLVLFSLTFGYFTLFHFLAGQTPGKMLTGLRVETDGGEPLAFSQAFMRSVGGLLQLLPLGVGYLQLLFSGDGRGWNDRLAGTRIVMVASKK